MTEGQQRQQLQPAFIMLFYRAAAPQDGGAVQDLMVKLFACIAADLQVLRRIRGHQKDLVFKTVVRDRRCVRVFQKLREADVPDAELPALRNGGLYAACRAGVCDRAVVQAVVDEERFIARLQDRPERFDPVGRVRKAQTDDRTARHAAKQRCQPRRLAAYVFQAFAVGQRADLIAVRALREHVLLFRKHQAEQGTHIPVRIFKLRDLVRNVFSDARLSAQRFFQHAVRSLRADFAANAACRNILSHFTTILR